MKKLSACSLCILISFFAEAQNISLLHDPGDSAIILNEGWTYRMGDEPEASRIDYEDAGWKRIQPDADIVESIPNEAKSGIGWMRLRFSVPEDTRKQLLAIMVRQSVASEIYLNGKKIAQYGVVSTSPSEIVAYDPRYKPVQVDISNDSIQVLAVRFVVQPGIGYSVHFGTINPLFSIRVMRNDMAIERYKRIYMRPWLDLFGQGIIFMVFILHFSFFIMLPAQRANLYFALAALLSVIGSMAHNYYYYGAPPDQKLFTAVMISVFYALSQLFMLTSIHSYLKLRSKILIWILASLETLGIILGAVWYRHGFLYALAWMSIITYLFVIFISIVAQIRRVKEAMILTIGFGTASVSFLIFIAYGIYNDLSDHILNPLFHWPAFVFTLYILAPPAAVSIFLAYDFARTGRRLQDKLDEVEILSEKNVAVEREKQELLSSQNIQLEAKVNERTAALNHSITELKSAQSQLIQSEKMASLGELTAGIAHEIQNPLNFVNNFSEVSNELLAEMKVEIEKGNYGEVEAITNNIKQNLEKILHHGKRADGIVKGMLQHSHSSTGVKEPTDINALADEYLRLAYHGFRAKDKSFSASANTELDKSIGKINVVPQDIGRVVLNLISNAFFAVTEKQKHAAAGYQPNVSLTTKRHDDCVLISVKDNGNGIPKQIREKIFQPFFTTKPTGQGTGLGLSLSYDIVKAHGGELKVETTEGEGSEFIISIML